MGTVNATSIATGSVVNSDIASGAGISASKLQHQQIITIDWGYTDAAGSIAVQDRTFFIASGNGTIREVKAWCVDSGTNTDIDFDLEVNGSTILTGDITVVHGTGDQTAVSGTVSSGSLTAGDYVTAVIKLVTQNTGALGPRMQVVIDTSYV